MGPRSIDRGIALMVGGGGDQETLQWGRDQLIAELARSPHHDHMGSRASMGPRSIDRGIPRQHVAGDQGAVLQWGRDQLIAELGTFAKCPLAMLPLQWGRDQL